MPSRVAVELLGVESTPIKLRSFDKLKTFLRAALRDIPSLDRDLDPADALAGLHLAYSKSSAPGTFFALATDNDYDKIVSLANVTVTVYVDAEDRTIAPTAPASSAPFSSSAAAASSGSLPPGGGGPRCPHERPLSRRLR